LIGGALYGAAARHFITAITANGAGGADKQAAVGMSAFGVKQTLIVGVAMFDALRTEDGPKPRRGGAPLIVQP
jgi:hypothetical protein